MGDADDAQFNALAEVFGNDSPFRYLICFYHVIAKIIEWTQSLSPSLQVKVMWGVYDLHFSCSDQEFLQRKDDILARWRLHPGLDTFRIYFEKQWLQGKFTSWHCYTTPPGFAKTNNPVERFNRVLKRDYTNRRKLKVVLLLKRLLECCHHESLTGKPFKDTCGGSDRIQKRATGLRRQGLLQEMPTDRSSIAFLVKGLPSTRVVVLVCEAPRVFIPARKRTAEAIAVSVQMGMHTSRMEVEGQPSTGWSVDTSAGTCDCRFNFKYGECVHVVFARWTRCLTSSSGDISLVDRRTVSQRSPAGFAPTQLGRPARIGHALDRE